MTPLVSVMMPCYNATLTLPWALASLVAQTYGHWECVLVDDASTDDTKDLIDQLSDPRIKYVRSKNNKGRGAARQSALERSGGDFLCMLDADDWMYPNRIEKQVHSLQNMKEIALVSSGMAVVDGCNQLMGVRGTSSSDQPEIAGPLNKQMKPGIAFPASMIRMEVARQVGFDPNQNGAEDTDFLIRALHDNLYCKLPDVNYSYSELGGLQINRIRQISRSRLYMLKKYKKDCFYQSFMASMETRFKLSLYTASYGIGLLPTVLKMRNRKATDGELSDFLAAREQIGDTVRRAFS